MGGGEDSAQARAYVCASGEGYAQMAFCMSDATCDALTSETPDAVYAFCCDYDGCNDPFGENVGRTKFLKSLKKVFSKKQKLQNRKEKPRRSDLLRRPRQHLSRRKYLAFRVFLWRRSAELLLRQCRLQSLGRRRRLSTGQSLCVRFRRRIRTNGFLHVRCHL